MAVAHDTNTVGLGTDGLGGSTATGDQTFSHAANANAKGAIVLVSAADTTLPCSGVLYGGTAMQQITSATDTTETGGVWLFFLGNLSGLGGTQTVTIQNCTATAKHAWCATVTAATAQTAIAGYGATNTTESTNPTLTFALDAAAMVYGGMHGGASAETAYDIPAGETLVGQGPDYGAKAGRWARSTDAASQGNYTFSFVYATVDDWCIAALGVKEAAASPIYKDLVHAGGPGNAYSTVDAAQALAIDKAPALTPATSTDAAQALSIYDPGVTPAEIEFRYSGGASNTNPATSLGGVASSNEGDWELPDEIFAEAGPNDAATGVTDYICLYLHNNTTSGKTLESAVLWIDDQANVGTYAIGLDSAAVGQQAASSSPDNRTAPSPAITFTSPTTKAGGLSIGNIPAGQSKAIWIRRTLTAQTVDARDNGSLRVEGDTTDPFRIWSNGVKAEMIYENCLPVGWYNGTLVYNAVNDYGVWDMFIGTPHAGLSLRTGSATVLATTHARAFDMRGANVLCTVAPGEEDLQIPGKGRDNDIFIYDASDPGGTPVQLTTDSGGAIGIIWPMFNSDGTRIAWTEQFANGGIMGYWEVHVADISGGTLVNEYSFRDADTAFYETYGWTPGGELLFLSSVGFTQLNPQLFTRPDQVTATATRLSDPYAGSSPWHEHAHVAPAAMFGGADPWLLYGTTAGDEEYDGNELWRMNYDKSDRAQVTYFNAEWSRNVLGYIRPDPNDSKLIHVGMQDWWGNAMGKQNYYLVRVP